MRRLVVVAAGVDLVNGLLAVLVVHLVSRQAGPAVHGWFSYSPLYAPAPPVTPVPVS